MMDDLLNARPGGQNRSPSIAYTEESSSKRGVNFTMFLTMMSERLFEFDPEPDLVEAFECFDEDDSGYVKVEDMRKWMSEVGERMDMREVRAVFVIWFKLRRRTPLPQIEKFLTGQFTDRQGNFNYREWVKVLSINAENEEGEAR